MANFASSMPPNEKLRSFLGRFVADCEERIQLYGRNDHRALKPVQLDLYDEAVLLRKEVFGDG